MEITTDQISIKTANPKCWLFLNFFFKWPVKVLGGRRFSVWGPRSPPPPPLHTVWIHTPVLIFSHREGVAGGGLKARGALVHKGVENTNMTDCISSLQTLLNRVKTTFWFGVFIDIWSMEITHPHWYTNPGCNWCMVLHWQQCVFSTRKKVKSMQLCRKMSEKQIS